MLSVIITACTARHVSEFYVIFFFNDTATTEIYTLSLHDALPICPDAEGVVDVRLQIVREVELQDEEAAARCQRLDRKSTRLNSSHANISYAVFCLKKKKKHLQSLSYGYDTKADASYLQIIKQNDR